MAITAAAVATTVLYQPGRGSTIGGGYPQLAATVLGIDPTGLILGLRVMPPGVDPIYVPNVRHASVAAVGEQSWSYPAGGGTGPSTIFQSPVLTVQNSAPATWPMPCRSGICMITAVAPPNSSVENDVHIFAFLDTLQTTLMQPSGDLTGTITNLGTLNFPNFLLTITSTNLGSAVPVIVTIYSGGQ